MAIITEKLHGHFFPLNQETVNAIAVDSERIFAANLFYSLAVDAIWNSWEATLYHEPERFYIEPHLRNNFSLSKYETVPDFKLVLTHKVTNETYTFYFEVTDAENLGSRKQGQAELMQFIASTFLSFTYIQLKTSDYFGYVEVDRFGDFLLGLMYQYMYL